MHGLRPLWLLVLAGCAAPSRILPAPAGLSIDTVGLRAHTWFLAQDALRGRGTGDPATLVAAHYIVAQCRALGLAPVAGAYLHPVPLLEAGLHARSTVTVSGPDTTVATHGRDFVVTGGSLDALRSPQRGRALWLGAPDSLPAALPDLTGHIGVTAGVPDPARAVRLAEAGLEALVALVGDDPTLARYAAAYGSPLRFPDDTPSSFFAPMPMVVGGAALTRALLPVTRGAERSVEITLDPAPRAVEAFNVACLLPGTIDTAIAFTAHYDHLGVGAPVRGDSIYNGFSDNAAGVAMLLGIAERVRRDPMLQPRHGLLFLFFTAEERGLLGSDWWVAHPAWPLERTRAVINLDAGAPPGRVWSWRVAGGTASWLGPLAQDVAAARGWTATLSAPRANSDYFPFHRMGVPAVFPIPSPAPYEGLTADSSNALRRRWDAYHQLGDEWFADFPFGGLARYAEYALAIAMGMDRR